MSVPKFNLCSESQAAVTTLEPYILRQIARNLSPTFPESKKPAAKAAGQTFKPHEG
jgi:hypothetical protein